MSDFHFYCVICGFAMNAPQHAAGGLRDCPRCRHLVPIPGYPATPGEVCQCAGIYRPEILEIEMKFLCPGCRARVSVDLRLEKHMVECPRCQLTFKVPAWSGSPPDLAPAPKA